MLFIGALGIFLIETFVVSGTVPKEFYNAFAGVLELTRPSAVQFPVVYNTKHPEAECYWKFSPSLLARLCRGVTGTALRVVKAPITRIEYVRGSGNEILFRAGFPGKDTDSYNFFLSCPTLPKHFKTLAKLTTYAEYNGKQNFPFMYSRRYRKPVISSMVAEDVSSKLSDTGRQVAARSKTGIPQEHETDEISAIDSLNDLLKLFIPRIFLVMREEGQIDLLLDPYPNARSTKKQTPILTPSDIINTILKKDKINFTKGTCVIKLEPPTKIKTTEVLHISLGEGHALALDAPRYSVSCNKCGRYDSIYESVWDATYILSSPSFEGIELDYCPQKRIAKSKFKVKERFTNMIGPLMSFRDKLKTAQHTPQIRQKIFSTWIKRCPNPLTIAVPNSLLQYALWSVVYVVVKDDPTVLLMHLLLNVDTEQYDRRNVIPTGTIILHLSKPAPKGLEPRTKTMANLDIKFESQGTRDFIIFPDCNKRLITFTF